MAELDASFYELWPNYGKDVTRDIAPTPSDISKAVLDACDINNNLSTTYGSDGNLKGVDIKNVDASQALKMSLIEKFAKDPDYLVEAYANEYGVVELVQIGHNSGNISDIYYEVPTDTYLLYETVVKITGKKPEPIRRIGEAITLTSTEYGATIYNTSYIATNCRLTEAKKHATIVFPDPHKGYTDPTDNVKAIYEAEWPWEKVQGWLYFLNPNIENAKEGEDGYSLIKKGLLKVFVRQTSSIPILIAGPTETTGTPEANPTEIVNIGTLIRKEYNSLAEYAPECIEDTGNLITCSETTIPINIGDIRYDTIRGTEVDKFQGVARIYVVGQEIAFESFPKDSRDIYLTNEAYKDHNNWNLWVDINNLEPKFIALDEGKDYIITQEPEKGNICVQFINNADWEDYNDFGTGVEYQVFPFCTFYNDGANQTGIGTILPRSNNTGILIQQVWAQVDLDVPSIVVADHTINPQATAIAENVIFQMAPILFKEEPAPISIDGELLDLSEVYIRNLVDADPTTVQDFEDTRYEEIISSMDGKQVIELHMATLSENETVTLSSRIKEILDDDKDKDVNISYVCGPHADPQLGGRGNAGGIVNSISYNYSDMGSYTITVNEGPYIVPGSLTGISDSVYIKLTEQRTEQGKIIQDVGNGVLFKILVDGMGIFEAINSTSSILKVGDIVQVQLNNVPVEK